MRLRIRKLNNDTFTMCVLFPVATAQCDAEPPAITNAQSTSCTGAADGVTCPITCLDGFVLTGGPVTCATDSWNVPAGTSCDRKYPVYRFIEFYDILDSSLENTLEYFYVLSTATIY